MVALDASIAVKAVQVAAVAAIGVYTYRKDMLNAAGAFTAFAMGAAIVLFTNIFWLVLLFALLGLGSAATRFRYADKAKLKVAEKAGGRRSTRNVLANGAPSVVLAVAAPFIAGAWGATPAGVAYVSAVAVAAADTLASEFGSLAKRVRMITTLKPVPPGTDGGVSLVGQVAALAGATIIALLGALCCGLLTQGDLKLPFTWATMLIPIGMGFLGCQVDSVIGATLETRELVTKEEVNFISIAVGGGLGFALALVLA